MPNLNRRCLLLALVLAANFAAGNAMAKDGDSGGGSGNSGSGSSNSGSGSGNSGSDDDGEDDEDEKDDDAESGSGKSQNGRYGDDHDRALRAVRQGKAVSLKKLKDHLAAVYPGKVLAVNLRRSSGEYFYNVRVLGKGNRIRALSLNALTLKPRGN